MCLTCSIVKEDVVPVGGIIYKDDYVILHHCIDENIAGYLIISPIRHIEHYSDLSEIEIQRIGTISKFAIAILKGIEGVEKIYQANFGEETSHFHMHIFPRYKWMLNYHTENICTSNKIDGAKLLSFCREKCKVEPERMEQNNILQVIEYIRNKFVPTT